jgi:hypothetical protein
MSKNAFFLILYCKGTAKILYLQEKIKNIFRNYYLIDLNQEIKKSLKIII